MNDDLLATRFPALRRLSLLAVGGATAVLPEAHRQLVDGEHWLTAAQFAETLRHRPDLAGPQCHCFQPVRLADRGLAGLLAATLGILGPSSLLAYAAARAHAPQRRRRPG